MERRPSGRGMVPGKPGGFCEDPSRGAEVRPFRARGNAVKTAASKPPFSFSEEKENAPFDGVREKGSGGGIPDFVRNARGACYGGFGPVETFGFCSLN